MIDLVDLLGFYYKGKINLKNYKVHLATGPNKPLEAFFEGKFKEWQEWQTKRNFQCEYVISLIDLGTNKWLFAGVYKINGYTKISDKHYSYDMQLIEGLEDLIGRIIISYKRKGRASYIWGKPESKKFEISEILAKKTEVEEFPSYNSVIVSYSILKIIIDQNIQSWKGALSNIKGIYLITDINTGKLYVGSATGFNGIWSRWTEYINNGHGGNKSLMEVLNNNGIEYRNNFQYSILEISDFHTSDDFIKQRERYWMNVLKTKEFGYNN